MEDEDKVQLQTPPEEPEVSETSEEPTAEEPQPPEEGAEPEPTEPEEPQTVPYARFKEVYGTLKRTERELESMKRSKPGETAKQVQSTSAKPQESDFDNYSEYVEALTDWKAEQREAKHQEAERERQWEEQQRRWDEQVSQAIAKDPKFIEKGYVPQGLVQALDGTDYLVEFAYHFGNNPAEAQRIMGLPPVQQGREIARLEAKFAQPPARSQTRAPAPTRPTGGKETVTKNPDDMDYEEYKAWRAGGGK